MAMNYNEIPRRNQDLLTQAIERYKGEPFNPELVTNYWRAKLQADGVKVGIDIVVPDCDWTEEEIRRPMVDIKGNAIGGMMVPVLGEITLPLLGKMYPKIAGYSVREDTPIKDTHKTSGYVKVEATIDAPNRNTRPKELEDFAKKQGYLGQREITYILASQASKNLIDQYFDQGETWSRLLGSRSGGYPPDARFNPDGDLVVGWHLGPQDPHLHLGARFEEVK